ncbi:RNA exonuclease 3 [Geranomyces variabilis]|nr:RNA exonuclease 3 [Geranomyces variabilis]
MVSPVHAKYAAGDSHPPPVATALGDNDAFAKAWVSAHASLADSQKGHDGLVALKASSEEPAPFAQDETNVYANEAVAAPPSHSAPATASPSVGSFEARAAGYVSPTAIAALARPPAHRSMVGLARTNTAAPAPVHPSRVPASASAIIREGEPPTLKPNLNCKVPIKTRQKVVEAFYKEFRRIYAPFLAKRPTAAHQHAVKQETKLLGESTHLGYQGHALAIIKRLQARPLATSDKDVGIDGVYKPIAPPLSTEISEAEKSSINALVCSEETLVALGYPFPSETAEETAVEEEEAGNPPVECNRCSQRFIPTFPLDPAETIACRFHWGYARTVMHLGDKQRIWSCCQKPVLDEGCTEGPHVFKEEETALLHKRIPFKRFPPSSPSSPFMVGLDCEMSYTTGGMELTRVTVLPYIAAPTTNTDPRPRPPPLLDELVRTSWPVLDLNTRWSGIESLESAKYDINSVRDQLSQFIGSDTIIVGHGLENDLKAMRMFHTRVIDTAHMFPHPRGLPLRHPLRLLAQKVLGRFIQVQGGKLGHDSAEDAEACLDLVRTRIQKGGPVRF